MKASSRPVPQRAPAIRSRGRARYALREELAKGGMGVIYLAYDQIARREVVYKRLWLSDPSQRLTRTALFRREYDTLARVPHPNIVEVYDYGEEEDGTPYYVMERLGGADLARAAPLPFREACRVLRDVASALALLHARRLVHRDVSPNNVRLTADGTAKLLDFGALTAFGKAEELVGTPEFIAPESFSGAALDQRSDLYSLGALAYWTLTRRTPYGTSSIEALHEAFEHPPIPPSAYVAGLPSGLDELVLSLLATEPDARPAAASYVIDRLTSIAGLAPEADERRVAQSYLAHPPLAGRDAVLRDLYAAIDGARQGRGSAVLVEAESGFGRSALLGAAAQHAQLHGAVVLRARGDGSAEPFRVARTLIETSVALYPDVAPYSSVHSSIRLHSAAPQRTGAELVEVAKRHALLLESAQQTLLEVSEQSPLILIIDDLQLVDEQSLALLASLARAIDGRRITLVLSRLQERTTRVSASYAKLAASATRVVLAALSKSEVGALVQSLFGAVPNGLKLAHWLHAQSGGNPATTLDLLRLLMQRGLIGYAVGTFMLPFDVAQQISSGELASAALARLGDLRPEVAKIALTLSLHQGPLSSDELAAAVELPLGDVLLSLEELVQRGVVAEADAGYQLLASSLREALQRGATEPTRSAVHLSLARTLAEGATGEPRRVYDASWHLFAAGHDDEALALIVGRAHRELHAQEAVYRAELLERALTAARQKGYSKEQCLSLLLPLASSGFHGSAQRHAVHIDTALSSMADVCGMSLARRLRRYLGGQLALVVGLLYGALRCAFTPKRERLGSPADMLGQFVALVCDATALAAACCDAAASRRFIAWLDPLAVLPKRTPGSVMREFCLATGELAAGQVDRASQRYGALVPLLATPLKGLADESTRRVLYLGALNGRALSEASMGSETALVLADELGSDPFFASFAEGTRFSFYALRGDRDNAEAFRGRAELLALHGGISWTASSSLTQFAAYAATLCEDAIALMQAIAELERLAEAAPTLRTYKLVCEAWLEHIRGRSERALAMFDEVIETDVAEGLSMATVNRALHAAVLNALGMYARAEQACTRVVNNPSHHGERTIGMRAVQRERAVALAGLGRCDEAATLVQQQIAEALPLDNPLELGASHRDRARVALIARDGSSFDANFAEMERYFYGTRNPCLRRQCELLLAAAEQSGLRTKSLHASPILRGQSEQEDFDSETYVEPLKAQAKQ